MLKSAATALNSTKRRRRFCEARVRVQSQVRELIKRHSAIFSKWLRADIILKTVNLTTTALMFFSETMMDRLSTAIHMSHLTSHNQRKNSGNPQDGHSQAAGA
jgi:hypothetical protein